MLTKKNIMKIILYTIIGLFHRLENYQKIYQLIGMI